MPALVALIFLTTCLDWLPGEHVRSGQLRAMLLAGAALLVPVFRKAITTPIALFWAYMAFMWVMHDYQDNGLAHLTCFSFALLFGWWLARAKRLPVFLSWLGAAQSVFGLAQVFGWNGWGYANTWELYKPTGFFGQETLLGAFLVPCLAAALFGRRWLATGLILACLVATHSSFSVAGGGMVVLLWILSSWGLLPFGITIMAFIMAISVIYWTNPGIDWLDPNGRLLFWSWTYHRWQEQPLFGFGPGSWLPNAPFFEQRLTHAHNEFLEFLTEYGAAGAAPLLASFARYARGLRRPTWAHAACAGLLVDAVGNFPFHIPSIGVIFMACWLLTVRN